MAVSTNRPGGSFSPATRGHHGVRQRADAGGGIIQGDSHARTEHDREAVRTALDPNLAQADRGFPRLGVLLRYREHSLLNLGGGGSPSGYHRKALDFYASGVGVQGDDAALAPTRIHIADLDAAGGKPGTQVIRLIHDELGFAVLGANADEVRSAADHSYGGGVQRANLSQLVQNVLRNA